MLVNVGCATVGCGVDITCRQTISTGKYKTRTDTWSLARARSHTHTPATKKKPIRCKRVRRVWKKRPKWIESTTGKAINMHTHTHTDSTQMWESNQTTREKQTQRGKRRGQAKRGRPPHTQLTVKICTLYTHYFGARPEEGKWLSEQQRNIEPVWARSYYGVYGRIMNVMSDGKSSLHCQSFTTARWCRGSQY